MFSIDASSKIDASGRGFLGGGQNGNPFPFAGMTQGFQSGSQGFSGGSYGGLGAVGGGTPADAAQGYGNFRNPNEPGSGGAGIQSAARRGDAERLVSLNARPSLLMVKYSPMAGTFLPIVARVAESGGAVCIDAGTLTGSGAIRVNGGNGVNSGGGGGGGRIVIYHQNLLGLNLSNITAFGGTGSNTPGNPNGGAGTIYLQGPSREIGELIVDNNNIQPVSQSTRLLNIPGSHIALTDLRVRRGAKLRVDNLVNVVDTLDINSNGEFMSSDRVISQTVTLTNTGVIAQVPTDATTNFSIDLAATTINVDATSTIDAVARGFLGGRQPGNPFGSGSGMTLGFVQGSAGTSGGSYGGLGGAANGAANLVYGNPQDPKDPGSGGATISRTGGNGGGVIKIAAQSMTVNGGIRAGGGSGVGDSFAAGGSGGAIKIDVGTLTGTGQIAARGGNGLAFSGGGGGGRIAVSYANASGFSLGTQVLVSGGSGAPNGQNGTINLQQQMAGLRPEFHEAPVMFAASEDEGKTEVAGSNSARVLLSSSVNSSLSEVGASELLPSVCCLLLSEVSRLPRR